MEIHPILECGDQPSRGLWYVISPDKAPDSRVGLACVPRSQEKNGSEDVLVIGGANPSATFSDVFRLDWRTLQWTQLECSGFRSRYEHAAFAPSSFPGLIYAFGGANKSGNLDCLQALDIASGKWNVTTFEGRSPGPRTLHSAGFSGDKMYVFGGGHLGSDPVDDLQLHIFDAKIKSWTSHDLEGDNPSARHGHVMVVIESSLLIHGGMAGSNFFDDMFSINLDNFKSTKLAPVGNSPCARAGHSGSVFQQNLYIFGGMCLQGALDDFCVFDAASVTWTTLKFDCPPPAPRLDHSMLCTVLPVKPGMNSQTENAEIATMSPTNHDEETREGQNGRSHSPKIVPVDIWQGTVGGDDLNQIQNLSLKDSGDGTEAVGATALPNVELPTAVNGSCDRSYEYVPICVIIGGMDTTGNLFNDILVTRLDHNT